MRSFKPWPLFLLCLALTSAAFGQDKTLDLDRTVTIEEAFIDANRPMARRMKYTPISVVITNSGPKSVPGVLKVYRTQNPKSPLARRPLYYCKRLNLPPGKRTETIHYLVQSALNEDCLAVVFEPDKESKVPATEPIYPGYRILRRTIGVLLVSETVSPRGMFVGVGIDFEEFQWRTAVAERQPQQLPDSILGYDPYNAVILSDSLLDSISRVQKNALKYWVQAGGTVFVIPGRQRFDANKHGLADILPVESSAGVIDMRWDSCELLGNVPGPGQIEANQFTLSPGAVVLESQAQGHPLIVERKVGSGRVVQFAFPISNASIRSWKFARPLFARLLPGIQEYDSQNLSISPIIEWQLNQTSFFEGSSPVSIVLIGPLLFLYGLFVCPLAFRFGQKKRSPAAFIAAMVVIIFAALVVVFAILETTRGRGSRAASHSIVTLPYSSVELTKSAKPLSKIESVIGAVHDASGRLRTEDGERRAIAPWLSNDRQIQGQVFENGPGQSRIENMRVISWSFQRFYQRKYKSCGTLTGTLGIDKDYIVGELKNQSDFNFEEAFILIGGQVAEVGALKSGSTANRRLPLYPLSLSSKIYKKLVKALTQGKDNYHRFYPDDILDEEFNLNQHLLKMFRAHSQSLLTPRRGPEALFIGFSAEKAAEFSSNYNERVQFDIATVLSTVPLKLKKSLIRFTEMPGWISEYKKIEVSNHGPTVYELPIPLVTKDPASSLDVSFPVPKIPAHTCELESLALAIDFKLPPGIEFKSDYTKYVFEMFDYQKRQYTEINRWDGKRYRPRIQNPQRFLDPRTHQIRLRIRNESEIGELYVLEPKARFTVKYSGQ